MADVYEYHWHNVSLMACVASFEDMISSLETAIEELEVIQAAPR